jgi:hypothetical protein
VYFTWKKLLLVSISNHERNFYIGCPNYGTTYGELLKLPLEHIHNFMGNVLTILGIFVLFTEYIIKFIYSRKFSYRHVQIP